MRRAGILGRSYRELVLDGLAFLERGEVVVEEVEVEPGLEDSGEHLCPAEEVLHLVSVDPIRLDKRDFAYQLRM